MKTIARAFVTGFLVGTIGLVAADAGHAAITGDANRGEKIYEGSCTGCHSLDQNRIGPAHRGVIGRKFGLAPKFAYSPNVKNSKLVLTFAVFDKWLTNPQGLIPGARMGFRLADPQKRADVYEYLKREGAKKK